MAGKVYKDERVVDDMAYKVVVLFFLAASKVELELSVDRILAMICKPNIQMVRDSCKLQRDDMVRKVVQRTDKIHLMAMVLIFPSVA